MTIRELKFRYCPNGCSAIATLIADKHFLIVRNTVANHLSSSWRAQYKPIRCCFSQL